MSRSPQKKIRILSILIAILAVADILVISACFRVPGKEASVPATEPTEIQDETTEPEPTDPEAPVSTATVLATGDLLMHKKVIDSGKQEDGSYDFSSIFRYISPIVQQADYAVANLETTLAGTDNGYAYSGNPKFNSPDAIVDAAKDAGFQMLLTANNHSLDTGLVGFKRTVQVVREKGLETLGTYLTADEKKWTVVNVNGINLGMVCYTYSDGFNQSGKPVLNFVNELSEDGLLNYFTYNHLPEFYEELGTYVKEMKAAGADATILFIHWGTEYRLSADTNQTAMAQALCDLGIDAIVGGHPHVVEPMDLLTSSQDPSHKTVVLYSLGNAVSNQRKEEIESRPTGETEDGLLYRLTFGKYADGTVKIDAVDLIPTWVNMNSDSGSRLYPIIPLDPATMDSWQSSCNLTDSQLLSAKASLNRTNQIIAASLQKVQAGLAPAEEPAETEPTTASSEEAA